MKRTIKYPKHYVKSATDPKLVTTEAQMTKVILEHGWIDSILDWANDIDYNWDYNTPESFADFAEEQFVKYLPEYLANNDYVCDDPISLVSDEIWSKLRDEAMSGDFSAFDAYGDW